MIESRIKNELTLKRWRRFKAKKSAMVSLVCLLFCFSLTFMAPLVTNSKPVFLKREGKIYFPIFFSYHPKEFNINNSLVVDYRALAEDGKNDFELWPPFKWNPYESNNEVDSFPSPPSGINPMGTDSSGRDVFARLLYGFKYSILYAFFVWLISFFIGTILGGIMGFYGGLVDIVGQRFVEVFSTVPQFFLLIILISLFTPNLYWLIAISSIFGWISISYYVRGEFLKNRKREFVEAAKSMGASDFKILFKHILPNSLAPIITFAPFVIAGNIVGLASLDYLGFGLEVPTPSWGELLAQAQRNYTIAWWLGLFPSLAIFFTLTIMNLIGEGVRDAMDPKL